MPQADLHAGGSQAIELLLELAHRTALSAGRRESEIANEGRHAVGDLDLGALLADGHGADVQQQEPRLGTVGQPLRRHLAGDGIFQIAGLHGE